MAEIVGFDMDDAKRIRDAVRRVERMNHNGPGSEEGEGPDDDMMIVQLQLGLDPGDTAPALICDADGEPLDPEVSITVSADYVTGSRANGDKIIVVPMGDGWQSITGGAPPAPDPAKCRGGTNTGGAIPKGSSGTVTLEDGDDVTGRALCGVVLAGAAIVCVYNDYAELWDIVAAECEVAE